MFDVDAARLPWRQYLEKWRVRHPRLSRKGGRACSGQPAHRLMLVFSHCRCEKKLISDACRASAKHLNHSMQERLPVSHPLDGALSTVWAEFLGRRGRGEYPQVPSPRIASSPFYCVSRPPQSTRLHALLSVGPRKHLLLRGGARRARRDLRRIRRSWSLEHAHVGRQPEMVDERGW